MGYVSTKSPPRCMTLGDPSVGSENDSMLALDDSRWSGLSHAYGPANDIPDLLTRAGQDFRPGHEPHSAWFDLWSALCHQGDAYTASYAALPHLVAFAPGHLQSKRYDPLFLSACIELARLEGRGPAIPTDLEPAYHQAVAAARTLAEENVSSAWDRDSDMAIRASAAALGGDVRGARSILDEDEKQMS